MPSDYVIYNQGVSAQDFFSFLKFFPFSWPIPLLKLILLGYLVILSSRICGGEGSLSSKAIE